MGLYAGLHTTGAIGLDCIMSGGQENAATTVATKSTTASKAQPHRDGSDSSAVIVDKIEFSSASRRGKSWGPVTKEDATPSDSTRAKQVNLSFLP